MELCLRDPPGPGERAAYEAERAHLANAKRALRKVNQIRKAQPSRRRVPGGSQENMGD